MDASSHETYSQWWQPQPVQRLSTQTSSPAPSVGNVTSPYVQTFPAYTETFTTYPDMPMNQIHTDFPTHGQFGETVLSPVNVSLHTDAPDSGHLHQNYDTQYISSMSNTPQPLYSDASYPMTPASQGMTNSPYLKPMPPNQVYFLSRGNSLKEPPSKRHKSNSTDMSGQIRHSWPLVPTYLGDEQNLIAPVPSRTNTGTSSSFTIDIDALSTSTPSGFLPSSPQTYPQPRTPEAPVPSPPVMLHPSRPIQPAIPKRAVEFGSSVRPSAASSGKHACPMPTCNCSYKRKFELDRHMLEKHGPNAGRLLCPIGRCPRSIQGEGFDRMAHLVNHLTSGKHNWTKEQAAYEARKFNPKKAGSKKS